MIPPFKRTKPATKIDMEAIKRDVEHLIMSITMSAGTAPWGKPKRYATLKRLGVIKSLKHPKADAEK